MLSLKGFIAGWKIYRFETIIRFDQTLVSENEWLHVDIVHHDMIFLMFFQSLDAVKLLETYCASMMSGRFVVNFQMGV